MTIVETKSHSPQPRSIPALRVLVVDDNEDAAEVLAENLRVSGYDVDVAHDGTEALQLAATRPPGVALVDIGLPGIDGYELASRLRNFPGMKAIELIALTGYGTDRHRQETSARGFSRHLVKPVDFGVLLGALGALGG
jgi:CheY-like chemotaxis protein